MPWGITPEQEMIQLMAREFARRELAPNAAAWDRDARFPAEAVGQLAELGLCGMMVPERYGGSAAGAVSYSLALTEIARECAATAVTLSVTNLSCEPLLQFGSEDLKDRFLVPLASGKILGAFALTEPGAGSDPGGLASRAVKRRDHFVLNGTKVFITNGAHAGAIVAVVRTEEAAGNRGLTGFVVEKGTAGLKIGREEEKMGLRASNTVEVLFEEAAIPAANVIGQRGEGFKIAMVALDSGRIGIASQAAGIAWACLDEARRYALERKQFGRAIATFQAIQWMIADTATEIEAARHLVLSAARRKDAGAPFTKEASMAKLFASEAANRAAYRALQVHGGYGYTRDFKVERLYRDARVTTLYEGTSEIQRLVIARRVLEGA